MARFQNSIVGGIGDLIRQYIRSPNYVPLVSGWTINKDGSVEFNNGTFRGEIIIVGSNGQLLIYNPALAAGGLAIALSAFGGTDPFGNVYAGGLAFLFTDLSNSIPENVNWQSKTAGRIDGDTGFAQLFVTQFDADTNPRLAVGQGHAHPGSGVVEQMVVFNPDFSTEIESLLVGSAAVHTDLQGSQDWKFGAGIRGKYYYAEVTYPVTALANNVTTSVIPNTNVRLDTDYTGGNRFNGLSGQWTAPADGVYRFDFGVRLAAGFGAAGRAVLSLTSQVNGGGTTYRSDLLPMPVGTVLVHSIYKEFFLTGGSPVFFNINQNSGAGINTSTADSSYITITRTM